MVEIARRAAPDATFVRAMRWSRAPGVRARSSARTSTGTSIDRSASGSCAAPRAELVVVDSAFRPAGVAEDWQERVLNDGSRHRVYKRWFTPESLAEELGDGEVLHDGPWFVASVRAGAPQ